MFSHKCVSLCQLLGGLYITIMASGMRFVSGMELVPSITFAMSIAHKSYRMKTQSNISHENVPFGMKIQPRYVHQKAINQLNNSNYIVIDILLLVTLFALKCNPWIGLHIIFKLMLWYWKPGHFGHFLMSSLCFNSMKLPLTVSTKIPQSWLTLVSCNVHLHTCKHVAAKNCETTKQDLNKTNKLICTNLFWVNPCLYNIQI